MLSLKDFRSFEVNNTLDINGGKSGPTGHTSGSDYIVDSHGMEFMYVNGDFAGCACANGSFSKSCCDS